MEEYLAFLNQVSEPIRAGNSPRVKNTLKKAARALTTARLLAPAAEAHRLIARLELRAGKPRQALNAGRAALRVARQDGNPDSVETLLLLAWLHAAAGELEKGIAAARKAVKAADPDARLLARVWLTVSELECQAGDLPQAADSAEEAMNAAQAGAPDLLPETELRFGKVLLRCGCSQHAELLARQVARNGAADSVSIRALLLRGNAKLSVGALDGAARYFKAAAKSARAAEDARLEALALAALGRVELERRRDAPDRRGPASLARARRLGRRLRDAQLHAVLDRIEEGLPASQHPTPKAAAGHLVSLASSTQSARLVEACVAEGEYLARLETAAPPYRFAPLPLDAPLL